MKLGVSTTDDVTVLTPYGMLLGGDETDEFEDTVRDLDKEGSKKLLINLSETTFMNSLGLTVLFLAHARFARRGATVKLCGADRKLLHVFELVRLTRVYDRNIHKTEKEALKAFRSPPTAPAGVS
jgi:anti-anti-sigma factor